MAKKYHLPNVYALYLDSIHGFALGKEGLLVAANCTSCHGSHKILATPIRRVHLPRQYSRHLRQLPCRHQRAISERRPRQGGCGRQQSAPVCTDCHTAHGIIEPTSADFRMQSTPICGYCHRDKFCTYRDTFHSQLGCWADTWRRRAAGTATGRTKSARLRSQLAHQPGESGQDLRPMPCRRQRQLRPVPAARQRAQSQAEPGPLLHPALHEPAAGQRADLLPAAHRAVAGPLALPAGQKQIAGRKKCLNQTETRTFPASEVRTAAPRPRNSPASSCASPWRSDTSTACSSPRFWCWRPPGS